MTIVRLRRVNPLRTAAVVGMLWIPVNAIADPIVVPGAAAHSEGNSNNRLPFDTVFAEFLQYQQVYASAEFGGQSLKITGMAFRPDSEAGRAFASTIPNISMFLSTTAAAVDGLSATLDGNLGPDNTLVRSGPLSFASSFIGSDAGPKAFDIIVPFTAPFFYNPARGNLLLQVILIGDAVSVPFDAVFAVDGLSRAWNTPASRVPALDTGGLVTQFDAAATPEPASFTLLAIGLVGVVARRRQSGRTPALR